MPELDWSDIVRRYPPATDRCIGCGAQRRDAEQGDHPVRTEGLSLMRVEAYPSVDPVPVSVCRYCRPSVVVHVRDWLAFKRRSLINRGVIA